jgi:hypothetical protein
LRPPEPCLYPRGLARSPRSCRVRCCTTCTGVGEANWTDHSKDRLRFPYDFIFSRSHYLHPPPYVCISCVIHPLTAWVTADAIMRGGACCAVEQLALERAQASASVGRGPGPDLMIRTEHEMDRNAGESQPLVPGPDLMIRTEHEMDRNVGESQSLIRCLS